MISPIPKAPEGADLLRLYVELAAGDPGGAAPHQAATDPAAEVRHVRRALEMLDSLRRSVKSQSPQPADETETGEDEPQPVGPYEVLYELGRGGWGVVYHAIDRRSGSEVALKLPLLELAGHPQFGRRYLREATLLESLDHPNLVKVHEAGEAGWIWYLALEFCRGPNLKRWLASQRGSVSPRQAALIVAAIADGLQHAHEQGILHRDIKPTNILLDERRTDEVLTAAGLAFVPRLVDFGLAKVASSSGETTHDGMLIGTPAYMSPEQALGRLDQVSTASDTFALGIVLYELLAARTPFAGDTDLEVRYRVAKEPPPDLCQLRSDVSAPLDAICRKALNKEAEDRYGAARELADDLRRYLRGEAVWAPSVPPSPRRVSRRAAIGLAAVAAAAVPAGWFLFDRLRRDRSPGTAKPATFQPVALSQIDDPRLRERWVFHANRVDPDDHSLIYDDVGHRSAVIHGGYEIVPTGKVESIRFFRGTGCVNIGSIQTPTRPGLMLDTLTAEAWVYFRDAGYAFGGVAALFRDTGNDERGWVLGHQYRKFSFMLKGTEGHSLMTYLTDREPFDEHRWYHVAGTYDGKYQRLFVNGQKIGEATIQSGPILYPEYGFYELATYHDDDEYATLVGSLHEVRIYDAALSPEEIRAHHEEKLGLLPDVDKPHLGNARPMNSIQLFLNPSQPPGP